MEFEKLNSERKPIKIANQILEKARSGELKPGDKLPAESELAKLTGVSRASVREALAALRLAGVIETRAGDGTYLKEIKGKERIQEDIIDILNEDKHPLQLQEARSAFECGIMKSVVEKVENKDITLLEEILAQMRNAMEKEEYDTFIDLHKRFHLAIAKGAKNIVIEEIVASFTEIMAQRLWKDLEREYYLPKKNKYLKESITIHRRIYEAIKKKDPELSTKRMREHFERYS